MADSVENNPYVNRIPPHDNESEQMVLGCMLCSDEGVRVAVEVLYPEDFYSPANRLIFEACVDLYNNNKPVDFTLVKEKIESMGYLEQVGGIQYLAELSGMAATSANTRHYADIVKKKAVLRNLVKAGNRISQSGYEGSDEIDVILANAEKDIFEVSQNRRTTDFTPIDEVMAEVIETIDRVSRSHNSITGVPTGFIDFDFITAGLQKSDLIIVAGRPAMGKTTFALNIAQNAAVEHSIPVAIFSLEMSREQLGSRMLSAQALVDSRNIRDGRLTAEEFDSIAMAMGALSSAPIYIYDSPELNPAMLREKCRRLQMEKGIELVVVDYMQLMQGTGNKNESDQQRVSYISRSLKAIARELNIPVIALSQLSRGNESRNDKRPVMSDLRESGAIEQDADLICLLFREEYYKKDDPELKNKAEVIIAKHRKGATGKVNLIFRGEYTRFDNALPEDSFNDEG